MEIKYDIADDKVRNFTDDAKSRLQEQALEYTLEIISEAEKVEKFIREHGASPEITDNIIFQAVRRNKTEKKKSIFIILVRIIAELLLFIAGLMFLPDMFITAEGTLNISYFLIFVIVTVIAIIASIVTYFVRGE
ncbi:MAG: hypothetical protein J1E85_06385 [Ruminococcus sp.]|nr:hypothetical protein [Ruminococcus sp.]